MVYFNTFLIKKNKIEELRFKDAYKKSYIMKSYKVIYNKKKVI